jgi:hypothetical protein
MISFAITLQQSCGNDGSLGYEKNVIGGDGISKTGMWKKCASLVELRRCGNVPYRAFPGNMPVPTHSGAVVHRSIRRP